MLHANAMPRGLDLRDWGEFVLPMAKALRQEREISLWLDQHPAVGAYWKTAVSACERELVFCFSDPEIAVAFKLAFG